MIREIVPCVITWRAEFSTVGNQSSAVAAEKHFHFPRSYPNTVIIPIQTGKVVITIAKAEVDKHSGSYKCAAAYPNSIGTAESETRILHVLGGFLYGISINTIHLSLFKNSTSYAILNRRLQYFFTKTFPTLQVRDVSFLKFDQLFVSPSIKFNYSEYLHFMLPSPNFNRFQANKDSVCCWGRCQEDPVYFPR